jgi:hypothetical protein
VRRRVDESKSGGIDTPAFGGERVVIPHDPVNEIAVLAAALADVSLLDKLLRRILPDQFLAREAREAWAALGEVRRRALAVDRSSVSAVAGDSVAAFLVEVARTPPSENADWHVTNLLWDNARATAARGPVPAFLEALRDPKAEPERVRSLARQVALSFDGHEDRRHLHEPTVLVRDQMLEIEARVGGHASFPYGLPGLDYFDPGLSGTGSRRRMIPGAAPGQITVITAVSGGGKSTMAANMAVGMAFPEGVESDAPGRKVLYGAWEMRGGMTLELLSCISLGWSRSDLMEGVGPVATQEGRLVLSERMRRIASRVRFLGMPFRRNVGEKATNDRNLDLLQGYISDSGCEVFIADLWKRCLRDTSPEAEEDALVRQQVMVEDLRIHAILLQQQRLKDVEQREDKRPTREGIKGSGAWIEVADTIIGAHRPALWKRMDDNKIEGLVLKQRYGKWPLAVEFEWSAERGSISGGRPVEYDRPGEATELDSDFLRAAPGKKKRVY